MALTVLSFGGGQDSTTILIKLIHDEAFRAKYAPDKLLVIMADTGNEHEETYEYVAMMEAICIAHDIEFYLLDKEGKYYTGIWHGGLLKAYERTNGCGSKGFPKTCTDRLKIAPIYNFLDNYLHENYELPRVYIRESDGKKFKYDPEKYTGHAKIALKGFAQKYGKINMIIGIAAKEERRASSDEDSPHAYQRVAVKKVYPLIDIGYDRQGCQDYIASLGYEIPLPSNCIFCPYINDVELLYMSRFMPEKLKEWSVIEKIKYDHHGLPDNPSKTINSKGKIVNNSTVFGQLFLYDKLEKVKEKYGHMTDEELREYKMSHGHCVMSKY